MAANTTPPARMSARSRYEALVTQRNPVLEMARFCSALTIPSLIPPEGTSDFTKLIRPYQSAGARGVDNLSSKVMLALFPPGSAFFRLAVDKSAVEQFKALSKDNDPQAEIEEAMSKMEQAIMTELEMKNTRPSLAEGIKHLIVGGNVLLQMLPDGGIKMHPLANYVCKRDLSGEPYEIIVREGLSKKTMPEAVAQIVNGQDGQGRTEAGTKDPEDTIWLYTWVRRTKSGSWTINQEVIDTVVPGSQGTYPKDGNAWLPVRWLIVAESDYGRGRVEEYAGDLASHESLEHAICDFAANASKIVWLRDPGAIVTEEELQNAESGDILEGLPTDVKALMMEKFADFQVVKAVSDEKKQTLKEAFLLNSAIQRNAERVTAEEIRFMAGELEQALGGTYSVLSQELQRPLVLRTMSILKRRGKLPDLPKNLVKPEIITGLDGLGRTNDSMKLDMILSGVLQAYGQEALNDYYSAGSYMKRKAAALGLDITIKTDEEVAAIRQQRATQEMQAKAAPAVVKGMSDQALAATQGEQPPQQ